MRFVVALALMAGIVVVSGDSLLSQEKKDPPRVKGTLPRGWGQLGLTADQKSSIYKIQAKYREDRRKLEEKLDALKAEETQEMVKVLTADQKKKLTEAALGEKPKDSPKPKDGDKKDK